MKSYLKKQSQFWPCADSFGLLQLNLRIFNGFGCWKGYTAGYVKLEFYEY
jgi:hypothetical protein